MAITVKNQQNNFQNMVPRDQDGFFPQYGGVINTKFASFAYSAGTAELFVIPAGAEIVGWVVDVRTAFDGTGSNVIDIGNQTTDNVYADDLSMASAGQKTTGFTSSSMWVASTEDKTVKVSYRGDGAAAGALTLKVEYILR